MDDNSFPAISYADCVKTSSTGRQQVDSRMAPISWYDQVESYQNAIVVSCLSLWFVIELILNLGECVFSFWQSRANSMSTVLSDDIANNCLQRLTIATHRPSISHSMDSGQLSDLSSDNEQCSKSTLNKCATTTTASSTSSTQQQTHMELERRDSFDSCQTSSSVNCADPHCTRDHNQLSLMCQASTEVSTAKVSPKFEYDEGVLARRQKQIDYGKHTLCYDLYRAQVPR